MVFDHKVYAEPRDVLGRDVSVSQCVAHCLIMLGSRTDSQQDEQLYVSRHCNSPAHKKPITTVPCNPQCSATSIHLGKAGETDSDSKTPCVAEQQDHHNNPHLEYTDTERNSSVSKCLPPPQKEPARKCSR